MSVCLVCGNEVKEGKKYCSRSCYYNRKLSNTSVRRGAYKKCLTCGKKFYVTPYKIETHRYCSCECWTTSEEGRKMVSEAQKASQKTNPRTGENSPSWRGGLTPKHRSRLTTAKWYKLRDIILARDNHRCKKCGSKETPLHVHHILPWRYGGEDEEGNLITLCKHCHAGVESRTIQKIYKNAIKRYCKMCKEEQRPEIINCAITSCGLWHVRPYQR